MALKHDIKNYTRNELLFVRKIVLFLDNTA